MTLFCYLLLFSLALIAWGNNPGVIVSFTDLKDLKHKVRHLKWHEKRIMQKNPKATDQPATKVELGFIPQRILNIDPDRQV